MHFLLAILPAVFLFHAFSFVHANFTFNYTTPTQCDQFLVTWSGGTPPFELVLMPPSAPSRVFPVPSANFGEGTGSFQVQLPLAQKQEFLVTMSDASGFGSGGTSERLTVGPSVSNAACDTTSPASDYIFVLPDSLAQCGSFSFQGFDKAVQPITIQGVVEGGTSFVINPPIGYDPYTWIADVAGGTSVLFMMTDAVGRSGGSSVILDTSDSTDASCLDGESPTVLANPPSEIVSAATSSTGSPTSTTSSAASSTNTTSSSTAPASGISGGASFVSKKSINIGAIIGGVVGGVLVLAIIVTAAWYEWRKRRRAYKGTRPLRPESMGSDHLPSMVARPLSLISIPPFTQTSPGIDGATSRKACREAPITPWNLQALEEGTAAASHNASHVSITPSPYGSDSLRSGSAEHLVYPQHERQPSAESGETASSGHTQSSSMVNKEYVPTRRFFVHHDVGEVQPEEVIELPPQYSANRAPIIRLTPSSSVDHALPTPAPTLQRLPSQPDSDQHESVVPKVQPIRSPGLLTPAPSQESTSA